MSVEASREAVAPAEWPAWQGVVVNGVYPLRGLLNRSDHSAVFLTECPAQHPGAAAIKIIPAERVTLAQLVHWRTVAGLSHARLLRLFDAGLCQLDGRQFLFVVMEYAGQTLAQVLGNRALTPEEVSDMLPATLDALSFLHGRGLVHGRIKPANVLVVDDQLKLASDCIRPAGDPRASLDEPSLYDPPEADLAGFTAAYDMWGLGVTLVEALTQRPASPDGPSGERVPATLPPALAQTLQRCLNPIPAQRATATELQALFAAAPQAPPPPVPQGTLSETTPPAAPARESPRPRVAVPALVATGFLVVLVAIWAGSRLFHAAPGSRQLASRPLQKSSLHPAPAPQSPSQNPPMPAPVPAAAPASATAATSRPARPTRPEGSAAAADQPAQSLPEVPSLVVHMEMPTVARSALKTIHGHVKVAVLVIVDRSGTVVDALLKNPGPSAYFARRAKEAARKWTFVPTDGQDTREWLARFEFTRKGVTAHATAGS